MEINIEKFEGSRLNRSESSSFGLRLRENNLSISISV